MRTVAAVVVVIVLGVLVSAVRQIVIPTVAVVMVVVAMAAVLYTAGCEQESEYAPLPATAPSSSSRVPTTPRALPTSDEIFGSRSTTLPGAAGATATAPAPATTRAAFADPGGSSAAGARQPLDSPEQTVTRMFELMRKQDAAAVRTMLADPPEMARLRSEVALVAERMNAGATWEIVDSRTEGVAAVVIFRTTFPGGKEEFTPLPLVNRYDRWRVLMGTLNAKKLTSGERSSINRLAQWTGDRMNALHGVPATTTTTTAPATPPAAGGAGTP